MKINLYLASGFIDAGAIMDKMAADGIHMGLIWSPRRAGKTTTFIKTIYERGGVMLYVRRTEIEAKIAMSPGTSDIVKALTVAGVSPEDITIDTTAQGGIGVVSVYGKEFCKILAISTFRNKRGFDASNCTCIVYDEFIPEKNAPSMTGEDWALWGLIDTVYSNRTTPLDVYMLGNTNRIDCRVFQSLDLIDDVADMLVHGVRIREVTEGQGGRNLLLINAFDSPIAQKRAYTGLYQMIGTRGDYAGMALENKFTDYDDSGIAPAPKKGLRPYFSHDGLFYYYMPGGDIYINRHPLGDFSECTLPPGAMGDSIYYRQYEPGLAAYSDAGRVRYETPAAKVLAQSKIY